MLTSCANELLRPLHQRMPTVRDPVAFDAWLDVRGTDVHEASKLLAPYPSDRTTCFLVSPIVNGVRRDAAECIAPIEDERQGEFIDRR